MDKEKREIYRSELENNKDEKLFKENISVFVPEDN